MLSPQAGALVNDQIAANKRRSRLLVAGFAVLVAVVLALLSLLFGGGWVGLVVAVVVAAAVSVAAYRGAAGVALRVSRAGPAPVDEYARFHNVVEGLCIASGLPKPALYVIEDPAPNAFATGRNPRTAALVVTRGLLDAMNRIELEGVLAHELSHVKNHDILVSTLAVTMVGAVGVLADLAVRLRWWGLGRTRHHDFDERHGGTPGPFAALSVVGFALLALSPVAAAAMRRAINPRRETLADLTAVEMTRYPPGLISALEKLRDDSTVVHATSRGTAHLWLGQPSAQTESEGELSGWNRRFDTHPPLDERIALLREL